MYNLGYLPCIYRIVDGKRLRLVSIYHIEILFAKHLDFLENDILSMSTVMKSYNMSNSEALLLNDINQNHSGKERKSFVFKAGRDFLACMEEIVQFYNLINTYYIELHILTKNHKDSYCILRGI